MTQLEHMVVVQQEVRARNAREEASGGAHAQIEPRERFQNVERCIAISAGSCRAGKADEARWLHAFAALVCEGVPDVDGICSQRQVGKRRAKNAGYNSRAHLKSPKRQVHRRSLGFLVRIRR